MVTTQATRGTSAVSEIDSSFVALFVRLIQLTAECYQLDTMLLRQQLWTYVASRNCVTLSTSHMAGCHRPVCHTAVRRLSCHICVPLIDKTFVSHHSPTMGFFSATGNEMQDVLPSSKSVCYQLSHDKSLTRDPPV